jgi:gas vesicle protein
MSDEEIPVEGGDNNLPADPATRTGAGFLAGMIFGVFFGAGLALFFAPDRGNRTRARLRKRMRSLREDALETLDHAGTRTRKELSRRQRQIKAELERIRKRAKERAREARETLE